MPENGIIFMGKNLTMTLTACLLRPGSCQVPLCKPQSQKASAVKYSRWEHGKHRPFFFFFRLNDTPVLGLPRPQPRKRPCASPPLWLSWHPSLSPPHHRLWCAYIQARCSRRILQVLQVPLPSAAGSRQCVLRRGHAPCRCESGFPYTGVVRCNFPRGLPVVGFVYPGYGPRTG